MPKWSVGQPVRIIKHGKLPWLVGEEGIITTVHPSPPNVSLHVHSYVVSLKDKTIIPNPLPYMPEDWLEAI